MAPGKRQVKARRHLVCNHCHSLVDFAVSGCGKTWSETTDEGFTFQCLGCWKVDCLTAELARLMDIVKGMQSGGRVIARTTNGERGGKTNGRKEVRGDVTKRKSITRTMTGRKETGKKGTTEKAPGEQVSNQGDAKRRSYSEALIEGALRTERVFMGDSILRKTDRTLSKGEDVVVCLPGARIEHVTERVENVLGHGQGGSILVHVGTNNADRDGTTRIVKRYRELVETLKKTRVEQIILSGILPVMRGRGTTFRNCKRMAINGLLEQMCEEEGVGFVDLWEYFVGKEDMFMRDGLHLSGKGAAVFSENLLRSMNNGTGCNFLSEVKKTIAFIKKHLIKLQLKLEIQREQKIAFNIKHDSKSFYAYVRSKQKVQDKVGPLEGSDGNIITEGFLMAENLNEYFSSVFTREDISILPVLETKFEGREFDYLGQLIVTPTMVAMKIRDMKDNKSPGVDGIPPKLLLEIVEQISIPLAIVQFVIRMERSKHYTII